MARFSLTAAGSLVAAMTLLHLAPAQPPKELAVLRGHTNIVWTIALSADGRTLASGSSDQTVKVWDISSGKERFTLRGLDLDVLQASPTRIERLLVRRGAPRLRLDRSEG